ncbi:MAG: Hsp70 family protein [Clostridiales bacterium]|nr:Hsp70 family protein [Clostridiales bacterium]
MRTQQGEVEVYGYRKGGGKMIVSIDIGTSYSSVCILGKDGRAVPVDVSTGTCMYGGKYSLPSAVFVDENGNILVGQAAMNSRKRIPQNFRMEFKRDLGQDIPVILGKREFRPRDLYTELFRHMAQRAVKTGGEPVEKAYLTYPASFGRKKKEQIAEAAREAGLFDIELVDEPTAAAMCYLDAGLIKEEGRFLVYDFGGGTFDVSLVGYDLGHFYSLADPVGLEHCGGIDIDRYIYEDMLGKLDKDMLELVSQKPVNRMRLDSQLAELAIKAKHHLSSAPEFFEDIQIGFDLVPYGLSRDTLDGMISPLVGQTIQSCRGILKAAQMDVGELSAVLMVGGTSRTPLVQTLVASFAGNVPVLSSVDLELAVASGALGFWKRSTAQEKHGEAKEEEAVSQNTKQDAKNTATVDSPLEKSNCLTDEHNEDTRERGEAEGKLVNLFNGILHKAALEQGGENKYYPENVSGIFDALCEIGLIDVSKAEYDAIQKRNHKATALVDIVCEKGLRDIMPWILTSDGQVIFWGTIHRAGGNITEARVKEVQQWQDIVSISCGYDSLMGLKKNRNVVFSCCRLDDRIAHWHDITTLESYGQRQFAVDKDGRVFTTGRVSGIIDEWSSYTIKMVVSALGWDIGLLNDGHIVAVKNGGIIDKKNINNIENAVNNWQGVDFITRGILHIVGLLNDGRVVACGMNDYGQCNVNDWHDMVSISTGEIDTVGLRRDGSVLACGVSAVVMPELKKWKNIKAVYTCTKEEKGIIIGVSEDGTTLVTGYKSHKVITKKRMFSFLDEKKLVHTPIPTKILPFKAF